MIKINEVFLHEILWKEYLEYSEILEELISWITDEVINKIHKEENEEIIKWELN